MGYLIDIQGHKNMLIESDQVPRVGESVLLSPDTFEGQEETIRFRVIDVMHTVGPGYVKEIPVVLLDPIR